MDKITALAKNTVFNLDIGTRAISRLSKINAQDINSDSDKDLLCDVFATLYNKQQFKENPVHIVNNKILQYAEKTNSLENSRNTVGGNLFLVKATAPIMYSALTQDEMLKNALKEQEELEKLEEERKENQEGNEPDELDKLIEQKKKELEDKMDKLIDNPMTGASISSAIDKATDKGEEIKSNLSSWGLNPSDLDGSDETQIDNILNQLDNTTISKISKLLGRLNINTFSARNTKKPDGYTPSGVEYTKDIGHIFNSELSQMFSDTILGTIKVVDYIDNGLLGWKYDDNKEQEGSFMCYIDKSGSMSHQTRFCGETYTNEQIATAISISVAMAVNHTSQREYTLKIFSEYIGAEIDDKADVNELFKWAMNNPNGGTDIDKVLVDAMNTINNKYKDNIDILIITDELFYVSDNLKKEFIKFKNDKNIRVMILQIGGYTSEQLKEIADANINVVDLSNPDELSKNISGWVR